LKLKKQALPNLSSTLSSDEIRNAELFWLCHIQTQVFSRELNVLQRHAHIHKSSPLKTLSPFLDKDSVLRLGGRLKNAALSFDEQHPIILPKHHVPDLINDRTH